MKYYLFLTLIVCVSLLVFQVGCGPKQAYKVVPIKGTLTWQGTPVPHCQMEFMPEDTSGRISVAVTDSEGRFEAQYTHDIKGIQKGKTVLRVSFAGDLTEPGVVETLDGDMQAIVKKYGKDTPGLTLDITKRDNNFLIDMQ
ncbi:MAG: hypothetical protein Q4G68_11540 [Planctomycetia bacterium]|nr:hypothetical protein [Planctomycetia bacterium]